MEINNSKAENSLKKRKLFAYIGFIIILLGMCVITANFFSILGNNVRYSVLGAVVSFIISGLIVTFAFFSTKEHLDLAEVAISGIMVAGFALFCFYQTFEHVYGILASQGYPISTHYEIYLAIFNHIYIIGLGISAFGAVLVFLKSLYNYKTRKNDEVS